MPDGRKKNATNGHLGNEKATAMRIAAINVDVMMSEIGTTVGARRQCPRTQEQCRGSGVAPDPDKWLTMRAVFADPDRRGSIQFSLMKRGL